MNTEWLKAIEKVGEAAGYPDAQALAAAHADPQWQKALTDASGWIVLLHGSRRNVDTERGYHLWLAEHLLHRVAMEHATSTWEKNRALVRRSAKVAMTLPEPATAIPVRRQQMARWAIAASVLLALLIMAFYVQRPNLATAIGERRTIGLEDGTEVVLNSNTHISIDYSTQQRHVRLICGEAYFKVAKRPEWPFVVSVGNREVTALGTTFLVRQDSGRIAVTLLEGKVVVNTVSQSVDEKANRLAPVTVLAPGERVTYSDRTRTSQLDRPAMERITAWQHGLVNLDDMTLGEAVAEMNRYSTLKLTVEGPAAAVNVGGVFRSTDALRFARAVAMTHGLKLHEENGEVVISGAPRVATEEGFETDRQGEAGPR
jgi:transmembrane sensor